MDKQLLRWTPRVVKSSSAKPRPFISASEWGGTALQLKTWRARYARLLVAAFHIMTPRDMCTFLGEWLVNHFEAMQMWGLLNHFIAFRYFLIFQNHQNTGYLLDNTFIDLCRSAELRGDICHIRKIIKSFSNAFSFSLFEFRPKFHWNVFLGVRLAINQHCFRQCLGDTTNYCLNQCWPRTVTWYGVTIYFITQNGWYKIKPIFHIGEDVSGVKSTPVDGRMSYW